MRSQTQSRGPRLLSGLGGPTVLALCIPLQLFAADAGIARSPEGLWEVSKGHLKDPFRWPSVWRNSPQAGEAAGVLGLTPAVLEGQTQTETRTLPVPKPLPDWRNNEEKRTRAYLQKVGPLEPKPFRSMEEEAPPTREANHAPVKHYMTQAVALATPFVAEPSGGRVFPNECSFKYSSSNESEILQIFDEVTLGVGENAGVKPGDLFRTYEVGTYYRSYSVGRPLGRLVETNGVVEVVRVGPKTSVAKLVRCFGTISRNTRAAPLETFHEMAATGYAPLTDGNEAGQVVWVTQQQQLPQPYSYLVVDQGARKGFKLGDMVLFYNRNNGRITEKVLGDGLVVNVQEESCTVLIQDLFPGIVNRGDFVVAVQTPVL